MPDELWMEVCDTVQETRIKTIPRKKKCKKAKWLSEEVLQITVKRREPKSKGEKERYTYLNAEFQRIARRYKRSFLSDQCKEIVMCYGNPLQCSCLENPKDGGAWWAAVYGVAQSRTRLKRLSSSSSKVDNLIISDTGKHPGNKPSAQ